MATDYACVDDLADVGYEAIDDVVDKNEIQLSDSPLSIISNQRSLATTHKRPPVSKAAE